MKTKIPFLSILAIFLFAVTSCKDEDKNDVSPAPSIVGKWNTSQVTVFGPPSPFNGTWSWETYKERMIAAYELTGFSEEFIQSVEFRANKEMVNTMFLSDGQTISDIIQWEITSDNKYLVVEGDSTEIDSLTNNRLVVISPIDTDGSGMRIAFDKVE